MECSNVDGEQIHVVFPMIDTHFHLFIIFYPSATSRWKPKLFFSAYNRCFQPRHFLALILTSSDYSHDTEQL